MNHVRALPRNVIGSLAAVAVAVATSAAATASPLAVSCVAGEPSVCVLNDPSATTTLVALVLPIGSNAERSGEEGVAHYLEHLTFRDRSVEDGAATVGAAGIDRYGNAYTTPFATTYHWTVPPERVDEAIDRALRVLAPLDVTIDAADQERIIVQREREQRTGSPDAKRAVAIDAALYAGTPRERAVIGTADEIDALTLEVARAFHERHYDPASATLVIAGAVDLATERRATSGARAFTTNTQSTNSKAEAGTMRLASKVAGAAREQPDRSLVSELVAHGRQSDPIRLNLAAPFGAPERTQDILARVLPTGQTLAALAVIDAYMNSSLSGSPRIALEDGSVPDDGRTALVPSDIADNIREARFTAAEVTPGLAYAGTTITLRPTIDPQHAPEALEAAGSALDRVWARLVERGMPNEAFDRLRPRLLKDIERTRTDPTAAAWNLISWLESGSDATDWADYPSDAAGLSRDQVNAVLVALDRPLRKVIADGLPSGDRTIVRPRSTTSDQPIARPSEE